RDVPAERQPDKSSQDQAGGPTRVENVEKMGAVVGEERGHERIRHGLERAIRDREDKRAQVKNDVGTGLRHPFAGAKRNRPRNHVQSKRGDDQLSVPDLVAEQPADDDAKAESSEPGSV